MITAASIAPGARSDTSWQNNLPLEEHRVEIKSNNSWSDLAKKYAGIVDSRESLVRLALEFFGADLPWSAAAALRNKNTFFERVFESVISFTSFAVSPKITELFAKLAGKLFSPNYSSSEIMNLVNLNRHELRSKEDFEKGRQRILNEEINDRKRISQLYSSAGKEVQADKFAKDAQNIEKIFLGLQYDEGLMSQIRKIKEFTIVADSVFEGSLWGGFGMLLRWFRKNILGVDSFSGTGNYVNKEEAKKLGQSSDLALWQKIGGALMIPAAPVMNFILMKLTENKEKLANSKFLQMIDKAYEMTHGLYPKLGLMFSYTSLPKWIGTFITAQGKDELIERLIGFCILISSWWQGQKIFNGGLAKFFDKQLQNKYNCEKGILVDKEYHGKLFAEQARIHQVLEMTDHDKELQNDAKDAHAKTLYMGVGLHSFSIFLLSLLVNKITKWRVQRKLKSA
ncbi:MAG: hypothetical protein O3C63_04875 [Cyanobacteria bacterium]|nr:hypothetical protein [Cyanobacteriota bacterium]MDA1020576.1 hypothetical protein [Cyanobacteriota bacterium]